MTWIRVDVSIPEDQTVHSLADQLGLRPNEAIGLLVSMRGKFPAHARSGDLSTVPDTLVEKWAGWHGKAGRFASALRALVLNDHGVDEEWERTNGAALRAQEAAADRMAKLRASRAAAAGQTLELALPGTESSANGSANGTPNGSAQRSPLRTNERNERTAVPPRPRARGPATYAPGHVNVPPRPFCAHCPGVLRQVPGFKRPQLTHCDECPDREPTVSPTPSAANA